MADKTYPFIVVLTAVRGYVCGSAALVDVFRSPEEAEGAGLAAIRRQCPPSEGWYQHKANVAQIREDEVRLLVSTLPPDPSAQEAYFKLQDKLIAAQMRVEVLEVALSGAIKAAIAGGAVVVP